MNDYSVNSKLPSEDADEFTTVMSDLGWNLMLVVLVACVSVVASQHVVTEFDADLAKIHHGASMPDPPPDPVQILITNVGDIRVARRTVGRTSQTYLELVEALSTVVPGSEEPIWIMPEQQVDWHNVAKVYDAVATRPNRIQLMVQSREQDQ